MRKIIHVDMDCFFAAVEMRDNPALRDIPIAIGGSRVQRGVISTANYPARKFGVRSAMPTATALKLCPHLTLLPGRFDAYKEASNHIREIFSRYTSRIEPLSLDEALLLLNNTLYVGAVADPAQIWVVDATTLKLKTRIKNTGKWMTGLHYSAQTGRVYAANGSGEILVINPHNQRIEQRWKPLGDKPALLLNMAEDSDTGRLFVTDNSKAKTTLVLDIHSGKLLKQLDVGDSLAVQFNKKRHEIYISQRESGKVISLDASRYTLKKSWALPANPNSLLLSADGQTLFVTVKQPFNKDHSTKGPDSVVRIDLNAQ